MTHDEARERCGLIQGVFEEMMEKFTDEQLRGHLEECSENMNNAVCRIDYLQTLGTTDIQKEPKPL